MHYYALLLLLMLYSTLAVPPSIPEPITTNNSVIGDTYAAHAVGAPHGSAEEVMWSLGIRPVIHVLKSDLA